MSKLKTSQATKDRIKDEVGDFIIESVLSRVAHAESPVEGEDWPALSKKYRQKKMAEGLGGTANLTLEGDMLDSLTFKKTEDGIKVGFFGAEAAKADGHLHFSSESKNATAPKRRFLPGKGEEFVPEIQDEIQKIIGDQLAGGLEFDSQDFTSVGSKAGLYDVLQEYFPDLSNTEIKSVVARTPDLARFLEDEDLLRYL